MLQYARTETNWNHKAHYRRNLEATLQRNFDRNATKREFGYGHRHPYSVCVRNCVISGYSVRRELHFETMTTQTQSGAPERKSVQTKL
jgi:hypothetical protein